MKAARYTQLLIALCVVAGTASAQPSSSTKNPHGPLKIACGNCHTTTAWAPIRPSPEFDHNRQTHYPLRGMHANVACAACHTEKVFTNVGHQCADCHADLHRRQMGANCQECHSVQGWQVSVSSNKNHLNRFPLIGAHSTVPCESCHTNAAAGQFVGLSTDCFSCHQRDYIQGKPLNHAVAKLPTTCTQCHNVDTWLNARFDHNAYTKFPLLGAHASVDCASCHVGGRYAGTPTDCYSCHVKDYTSATDPNHVAAGFPQDCSMCHTTVNWLNAKFDHSATPFPLTGAHQSVVCAACHPASRFAGTPTACAGCHQNDYNSTTNPPHVQANFSTQCDSCHTTASWQNATFDHNQSVFPLTGAHASVACAQCHLNGQFATAPTDCYGCHQQAWQSATPNHIAAGFPQNCALCHTTSQWPGGKFDHSATKFPLTGAHATVTCTQCHTGNAAFSAASTACSSCHLNDFNKTTNPNHVTAGYPTDCTLCHTTAQWTGAVFNHSNTQFPLTGAHTTLSCSQCHTSSNFAIPTDCVS